MNIQDLGLKINSSINSPRGKNTYIVMIVILVALASYGFGRLSKIDEDKPSVRIYNNSEAPALTTGGQAAASAVVPSIQIPDSSLQSGDYVASRNGTKYHFPWCSGAQRIKEENKIWFETKEKAESAGYSPAANCKGL